MIELKTILYPTDFSENADHARPYVVDFAKRFQAKVVLLHAVPPPTYAPAYELPIDLKQMDERIQEAAREKIEKLQVQISGEGIETETVVDVGSAFVEIIRNARERNVDLIILSTHGYGAVKHLLLGSTAERVVRKAPCPVLTIRHPEHEFVHP